MGAFGDRNKKGAKNVMERAHQHQLEMLYLKIFGAWRLDTRIEQSLKQHQGRIDGKRQQLVGVQQMFRNFAKQLESNIQSGGDSNRDLSMGPPAKQKNEQGSRLSLPAGHPCTTWIWGCSIWPKIRAASITAQQKKAAGNWWPHPQQRSLVTWHARGLLCLSSDLAAPCREL